jgi:tetratricopeptide (TPR) repeat protein/TolB-like protein
VAVLFFQNLTGEAELEWLRTGLAEMLVTDLSQSPEIRVISTDRLYQVLQDLDAVDRQILSSDLVRKVAESAGAGTVLLGSYARAGENLLVNVTLQNASDGEIMDAQRVQGDGVGSVFTIVDRLSRSVRGSFESSGRIAESRRRTPERGIESVTTSSVEAYRFYVEGMRLNNELKVNEAIALFERAIELDPGFAMAHARLARIYETLGREEDLDETLERAIAHADRLPPRERYFVEGTYQSRQRATYGQAIETLEKAVDVYPDHHAARYQLGLLYSYLELYDRAALEFEELLARGYTSDGAYNSLASVYGSQGRADDARRLLNDWVDEDPDRWSALLVLAWHAVNWNDPDLALETLERAEQIRPGSSWVVFFRFRAHMAALDLDRAEEEAQLLVADREPYWQWRGNTSRGLLDLYRGRADEARPAFAAAAEAYEGREPLIGTARNLEADLLLATGRTEEALRMAEDARRVAEGDWPAWEGIFWSAVASERLGRSGDADRLATELGEIADDLPGQVEERFHHRLLGLLARERGDLATARRELEAAVELLPPRGVLWHRHRLPDHGALWYELASVAMDQGDERAAERWFLRLVEGTTERIEHPIEAVRSQYFLGRLAEERGDDDAARDAYRAFLSYWEDGDLDRERVADARRRFSALD